MLLSTSSRVTKDSGEILLNFFRGFREEKKNEQLQEELTRLTILKNKMAKRKKLLEEEIENPKSEMRLLSDINKESQLKVDSSASKRFDIEEFLESQKMDVFKYALGVHILERNTSLITFVFSPSYKGKQWSGLNYSVTLNKKTSSLTLDKATLPAVSKVSLDPQSYDFKQLRQTKRYFDKSGLTMVIPLQELADETLPKVDLFIKKTKRYLDAYISRFQQMQTLFDMLERKEINNMESNEDLTHIKFATVIGTNSEDSDEDEEIHLHLTLYYHHGDHRPIPQSMEMKLSGRGKNNLDDDAFQDLKEQCKVFYTHSIPDAMKEAFM